MLVRTFGMLTSAPRCDFIACKYTLMPLTIIPSYLQGDDHHDVKVWGIPTLTWNHMHTVKCAKDRRDPHLEDASLSM